MYLTQSNITFIYNRLGQMATVQDAAGTRTFTYNATLDLISESINGIYVKGITRAYTSTGMKGRPLSMSVDGNSYMYIPKSNTIPSFDNLSNMVGGKITIGVCRFKYITISSSLRFSDISQLPYIYPCWFSWAFPALGSVRSFAHIWF